MFWLFWRTDLAWSKNPLEQPQATRSSGTLHVLELLKQRILLGAASAINTMNFRWDLLFTCWLITKPIYAFLSWVCSQNYLPIGFILWYHTNILSHRRQLSALSLRGVSPFKTIQDTWYTKAMKRKNNVYHLKSSRKLQWFPPETVVDGTHITSSCIGEKLIKVNITGSLWGFSILHKKQFD